MHEFGEKHAERMTSFNSAGLYLVTSSKMSAGRTSLDIIRLALEGGARLFQLREKAMSTRDLVSTAREAAGIIHAVSGILIINDRIDVALAAGADGVHLGQEDLPVESARSIAPDMIIGASSHCVEEATAAQQAGASYVNIGPVYPTATKEWERPFLGLDVVAQVSRAVSIPFTVMGGIKKEHVSGLVRTGACTIAVVTAITAADNPAAAAAELINEITKGRNQVEAVDPQG